MIAEIDLAEREIVFGPVVTSRGWASPNERFDLESGAANEAREALEAALVDSGDLREMERVSRRAVGRYVAAATRRRPVIVPVIRSAPTFD